MDVVTDWQGFVTVNLLTKEFGDNVESESQGHDNLNVLHSLTPG